MFNEKKFNFVQFVLGAAVLFAILYPSLDGLNHLEKEVSETHCEHHYTKGKNEVNHSHHDFEKCFACEFTFSQFITSEIFSYQYKTPLPNSGYTFFRSREITEFFRGALFSHRGPPEFIA